MSREWARLAFESEVWGASEPDDRHAENLVLGRWNATVRYGKWQFGWERLDLGEGSPGQAPTDRTAAC